MNDDLGWDAGCGDPSCIDATALIAAADGESDPATAAHLAQCPHCAARLAQLRQLQSRLQRRLYRSFCPSTDQLVDYAQGLVDPYQRARLSHHLALCPHCAGEVRILERSEPEGQLRAGRGLRRLGVPLL